MIYCPIRLLFVSILALLLLSSCATYNQKLHSYHQHLNKGDYKTASAILDQNSFLQKPRNQTLYLAEKGRIEHLQGNYKESNFYLNQADNITEDQTKTVSDAVKGTLLNPMMQVYKMQDFEKFMIHFYKALNYCSLNNMEDAIVEARRITLHNNQLNDIKGAAKIYNSDPFSLMVQGFLYEKNKDINNAFISYRNAANIFASQKDNTWLNTPIPNQLKKDVVRTAAWMGFKDEQQHFETMFNEVYTKDTSSGGSLIIFWEHGKAPVKEEQNIILTLVKNQGGLLTYQDENGTYGIPIPVNLNQSETIGLGSIQTFRIALPKYSIITSNDVAASVSINGATLTMQPVMNINSIAKEVMKENRKRDIINALTRLVAKKAIEIGAKESAKAIVKNNDTSDDKGENADDIGAIVGAAFQAYSFFSEKADTRNWQTLPSGIEFVKVPLQQGINKIEITIAGSSIKKSFYVTGNGSMQLYSFYTN